MDFYSTTNLGITKFLFDWQVCIGRKHIHVWFPAYIHTINIAVCHNLRYNCIATSYNLQSIIGWNIQLYFTQCCIQEHIWSTAISAISMLKSSGWVMICKGKVSVKATNMYVYESVLRKQIYIKPKVYSRKLLHSFYYIFSVWHWWIIMFNRYIKWSCCYLGLWDQFQIMNQFLISEALPCMSTTCSPST